MTSPGDSFGNSTPVFDPIPNLRNQPSRTSGSIRSPMRMVPMLLDLDSTPPAVRNSVGWSEESLNRWSARGSRLGTTTGWSGVTTPSCSAAAMVMILFVDPGSMICENARLSREPLTDPIRFGS